MSDLQIALVVEGPTDRIIIEAALKAILAPQSFTAHLLQPETSDALGGAGGLGGGWGGVYRWCRQQVSMGFPVAQNPSLAWFDMVIVHLDADVAGKRYYEANIKDELDDLPCELPCPPAAASVDRLQSVISRWLNLPETKPEKWVFCIPSKCSEAWLVTSLYQASETDLMRNIECYSTLDNWLGQRPLREGARLIRGDKKQRRAYQEKAPVLTDSWGEVCRHCTQAMRFGEDVPAALRRKSH